MNGARKQESAGRGGAARLAWAAVAALAALAGACDEGGHAGAHAEGVVAPGGAPLGDPSGEVEGPAGTAGDEAAGTAGLVLHEWGTFTSVQGTDGVTLEGLHHEEEPLPPFVHDRCGGMEGCLNPWFKSVEILPEPVTQKLETPVIYVYAPERTPLEIDVRFPGGVISQWFPAAVAQAPEIGTLQAIADGAMTWRLDADPGLDRGRAPWVPEDGVWAPSRAVPSTPLAAGDEVEGFVFYRGLGRFELPVRVTTGPDGALTVSNLGDEALPATLLLESRGGLGGVVSLGPLAAGASVRAEPPAADRPLEAYVAAAREHLLAALADAGLFEAEARAMVDTWERSWVRGDGRRLLYVVPAAWTDALLPLRVAPEPDAVVRVLVGRIEALTPEEEAEAVQAVTGWPGAGLPADAALQGRFAEPRLRRACALLDVAVWGDVCRTLVEAAVFAVPW